MGFLETSVYYCQDTIPLIREERRLQLVSSSQSNNNNNNNNNNNKYQELANEMCAMWKQKATQ